MRGLPVAIALLTILPAAGYPFISKAIVDYNAKTLTISGTNLRGDNGSGVQSITLGATSLTVQSASATSIVAKFPSTAPPSSYQPGTYLLTVEFRDKSTQWFGVALGAIGPQGPPGITGAQGPSGS